MLGDVHAHGLLDIEATHTFRGLLRGARIDLATAERGLAELAELGVRRHPDARLLWRARELRDVCTTYDAVYVALVEALDATLVTRDTSSRLREPSTASSTSASRGPRGRPPRARDGGRADARRPRGGGRRRGRPRGT